MGMITVTADLKVGALLKKALGKWGQKAQTDQAIEEMAELTQALLHHRRGRKHNVEEEIADTMICLMQLYVCFDEEKISETIEQKLARLNERVNS